MDFVKSSIAWYIDLLPLVVIITSQMQEKRYSKVQTIRMLVNKIVEIIYRIDDFVYHI